MTKEYITKDSGERYEEESGFRRDTQEGKPRYDLVDQPMLKRWAELMARGAEKYGEDNWRLADSEAALQRFKASAYRHFVDWFTGENPEEDHGAAVYFNIAAAEYVKSRLPVPSGITKGAIRATDDGLEVYMGDEDGRWMKFD